LVRHIKTKVCESPLLTESVLAAEAHFLSG
jgi:hypothetical protein